MDRRTLLALFLATLVLLVYQFVFMPKPDPSRTSENHPRPPAAETGAQLGSPEAPAMAGQSTPFDNVLVERDLATAPIEIDAQDVATVLDSKGAAIREWRLRHYTDAQERPADLVADHRALFRLAVVGAGGRRSELADIPFLATSDGKTRRFEARDSSGASIRIDYDLPEAGYETGVRVAIRGFGGGGADAQLEISFPQGMPQLERIPKQDQDNAAALALLGRHLIKHHERGKKPGWTDGDRGVVNWLGVRSKYFFAAVIPESGTEGNVSFQRRMPSEGLAATLSLPIDTSEPTEVAFRVYAGPLEYSRLETLGAGLEKAVDFGWTLFHPITRALLRFFHWMHQFVPNYGYLILLLALLLKVVFFPLTQTSIQSMKKMQALKPEMDRLAERYKDDPQTRNLKTLELYKKNGVNPMSGCLPLLIQIPVFGALYSVLNTSIELRKAPFALWVDDLSAPDRIGAIVGQPIHILPVIMALAAFIQQKLTPTDPRQQTMFLYVMPIITLVFFYSLPSGLVLYWTATNVLQIGQQLLTNRNTERPIVGA